MRDEESGETRKGGQKRGRVKDINIKTLDYVFCSFSLLYDKTFRRSLRHLKLPQYFILKINLNKQRELRLLFIYVSTQK